MTPLLVLAGAAVGAPARLWLDRFVQTRHETALPWGTFVINVLGSLLLGLVAGALYAGAATAGIQALVGTGFCGTFTTFSSLSYETLRLAEEGRLSAAITYAAGSVAIGVCAAAGGWALGGML